MNHLIMSRENHLNLFSKGVKTNYHERTSLQSRRGCSISEVDEEYHFLYAVRLFQHPLSAGSLLGNYFEGGFFCLFSPSLRTSRSTITPPGSNNAVPWYKNKTQVRDTARCYTPTNAQTTTNGLWESSRANSGACLGQMARNPWCKGRAAQSPHITRHPKTYEKRNKNETGTDKKVKREKKKAS